MRLWLLIALSGLALHHLDSAMAATLLGSVTGPDGLMPGTKVRVEDWDGGRWETTTDENGNYSLDVPDGSYNAIFADPSETGLSGEVFFHFDAAGTQEIRLFVTYEYTISGKILLPDEYQSEHPPPTHEWFQVKSLDSLWQDWPGVDENYNFSVTVPAGVYAIQVALDCEWNPFADFDTCDKLGYLSSITVDARSGDVEDLVVPVAEPVSPWLTQLPPRGELIEVDEPDDRGIATVRGQPGTVPGAAGIMLINLRTGHHTKGEAGEDGDFEIPFLAPPGSYLEIRHDALAYNPVGKLAPGTLVRVPPDIDDGANVSVLAEACWWCGRAEGDGSRKARNIGLTDHGQVRLNTRLEDRQWSPGEMIPIEGELIAYTRNAANIDPADLYANISVYLERVFDENGKQEFTNPVFVSHSLTPTGMPIERRGDNFFQASTAAVRVGHIEVEGISRPNDVSFNASWSGELTIPADLPAGLYSLMLEPHIEDIQSQGLHFDNTYGQIFDTPFSRYHATLVTVGSPAEPRLSWVLGLDNFSNGSRGTVGLEDRDRIAIAGRQTANTSTFIVPMMDKNTGQAISYRLEPHVPLLGAGNRGWISPPPVSFKFPSGELDVQIEQPDGTSIAIDPKPFAQPRIEETILSFGGNDPGNHGRRYYGLTTMDPSFRVEFSQYGKHSIQMTGSLEDIDGRQYTGGGTYEVFVARRLDMEFGVFPGTPFEVGDSFNPSVIIQPGVAADVEIQITHFPESDSARKAEHIIKGRANRFGYFHTDGGDTVTFDQPGEYRVDIIASFEDSEGVLWMGSETWASVVETPDSGIIAHGARGRSCGDDNAMQWLIDDGTICGTHLPFPYHTGDIVWSMDTNFDPYFTAIFPAVTAQDTEGTLTGILRQRNQARGEYYWDFEDRANIGEIGVFSSTPTLLPATMAPDDPDTHWAYFYSTAARPGVRVREMVSEAENQESYWRFEGQYSDQSGVGQNGDEPHDFKFQFGGLVYRAPDQGFFRYGAYGSLWVGLQDDDPIGTRVMPPFQGNGGGPSGGPIMTLKGQDIDMFLHPMGVRPGSILDVGDVASFSGQVAPTLESDVWIRVLSPSGVERFVTGQSNKVGYFYQPVTDFVVDEPGVWTVRVSTTFTGQTSAGQVTEPFPTGDILGSSNGSYHFYVVEPDSQPLDVDIPAYSSVKPGNGPLDIPLLPTDELSDVVVHRTTMMPGFLLEESETSNTTYAYDAPALNADFPNLDIIDHEGRTGADTVTMSFLVSGKDGSGKTVYRARQVLLQGEELMAPEQAPSAFTINAGVNDAWVHDGAPNQGIFLTAFPDLELMFAAWFTFDSERPDPGASATIGAPDQRWITALGPYSGNTATLAAELTTGGRFNSNDGEAEQDTTYGTIDIDFAGCAAARVDYDFPSAGQSGAFDMNRVLDDNVDVCEGIIDGSIDPNAVSLQSAGLESATASRVESDHFVINPGLNDAWINPAAGYQGMILTVFPDFKLMFAAWFVFDAQEPQAGITAQLGAPDQRWLTAFGSYSGTSASLKIENTTNGVFESADPKPAQDTEYGTLQIDFADCSNAEVSFDIPSAGQSGTFALERVLKDNEGLCELLGGL